ncbi:MAG: hypothetical protein GX638_11910, partial [Crenarchaeota archaeon]|nr:hypothetical protein [Thermoproteota archaeon]
MLYLVFSKDRPLQLELTLNTCNYFSYSWNRDYTVVLYKASNDRFKNAYKGLEKIFPNTKFIEEEVFKIDFSSIISASEYVMFLVDDCVFTKIFYTQPLIDSLNNNTAILGFSLRLGKNTTNCYPLNVPNHIPKFIYKEASFSASNREMCFFWNENKLGDFYYPLELSSSIYRAEDILKITEGVNFNNPNDLEYIMDCSKTIFSDKPFLSCYQTSVAFCNPINKVQNVNNNRAGSNPIYSTESLLEKYEQGYKIDDKKFYGFTSNGCHQEVDL